MCSTFIANLNYLKYSSLRDQESKLESSFGLLLKGHIQEISCLIFSPDLKTIITGSLDNSIKFWDLTTYSQINSYFYHSSSITSLYFSSTTLALLSGSSDSTVKILKPHSMEPESLETSSGVTDVLLSNKEEYIVAGTIDSIIYIWEFQEMTLVIKLETQDKWIKMIKTNNDSGILIAGYEAGIVRVWRLNGEEMLGVTEPVEEGITCMAIDSRTTFAAIGGYDGFVRVIEIPKCSEIVSFKHHSKAISYLMISGDNKLIVSASFDCKINIWNQETRSLESSVLAHRHCISSLCFIASSTYLCSSSWDSTIKIWLFPSLNHIKTLQTTSPLISMHLSPNESTLISVSLDKNISVFNVNTLELSGSLQSHTSEINRILILSPTRILTASSDASLRIWDPLKRCEVFALKGHKSGVCCIGVSKNKKLVVSGSLSGEIRVWDLEKRSCVQVLKWKGPILCVAVDEDCTVVVAVFATSRVYYHEVILKVWKLKEKEEWEERFSNMLIQSIEIIKNGKFMVISDKQKKIQIRKITKIVEVKSESQVEDEYERMEEEEEEEEVGED